MQYIHRPDACCRRPGEKFLEAYTSICPEDFFGALRGGQVKHAVFGPVTHLDVTEPPPSPSLVPPPDNKLAKTEHVPKVYGKQHPPSSKKKKKTTM